MDGNDTPWTCATTGRADPDETAPENGSSIAAAIVRVVDSPAGERPFRVHIDPADDGAEVVNAVGDRIRTEFYRRIGLDDLLRPSRR